MVHSHHLRALFVIVILIGVLTLGMAPTIADAGNNEPVTVTGCGAWDFNHVILNNIDGKVFNISFEWMPLSGAATYRFKLHRQGVAPFEYLLYGDLGTLVDISDLEPDVVGTYTFMVTAYDDAGNELCTTPIEGHSFEIIEVYIHGVPKCTPYVVVLPGSPYTGAADITPPGNNYDGRALDCGATIYGNNNSNIIYGTPYDDIIYGYGGNDEIHGVEGDDTIYGGAGRDFIFGGTGSDTIEGNTGVDWLFGGWDNRGGESRNDIGSDTISDTGGDNMDMLFGGNLNANGAVGHDGSDTLTDSGGNMDMLYGGNWNLGAGGSAIGNDNVGGGNDVINAQDGVATDRVYSGNYNFGASAGLDFGAGGDTLICDIGEAVCLQGNNP